MSNIFRDSIEEDQARIAELATKTHEVTNHPHFFQHAIERQAAQRKAANMTRQEQFNNGILTVKDMDDEELRCGRMRGPNGKIPDVTRTMENIPRDLYEDMIAEHQKRTNERIRQQLDMAIDTMVDVMTSDLSENKDRLDAAKYLFERQMGKTPDRVQVQVSKAPWEELLGEVAHITRAQHEAMKAGAIDAEVVELPEDSAPTTPAQDGMADIPSESIAGHRYDATAYVDVPVEQGDVQHGDQSGDSQRSGPGRPSDVESIPLAATGSREDEFFADYTTFAPAEPTPTHDLPAHSNPTLSQQLREANDEAIRVAEARRARKDLMAKAKKRRIAMRATGADVLRANIPQDEFAKVQERFAEHTDSNERDTDEIG